MSNLNVENIRTPQTADIKENDVKAEIKFVDGVPIPPSVRPVIILKGSDYEMGYQWFQQYIQIFSAWILEEIRYELSDIELALLKNGNNIKKI